MGVGSAAFSGQHPRFLAPLDATGQVMEARLKKVETMLDNNDYTSELAPGFKRRRFEIPGVADVHIFTDLPDDKVAALVRRNGKNIFYNNGAGKILTPEQLEKIVEIPVHPSSMPDPLPSTLPMHMQVPPTKVFTQLPSNMPISQMPATSPLTRPPPTYVPSNAGQPGTPFMTSRPVPTQMPATPSPTRIPTQNPALMQMQYITPAGAVPSVMPKLVGKTATQVPTGSTRWPTLVPPATLASSTRLPTQQPTSSTRLPTQQPASSTRLPTQQPASSTRLPTQQPASSTRLPTQQPGVMPTAGLASPTCMPTNIPPMTSIPRMPTTLPQSITVPPVGPTINLPMNFPPTQGGSASSMPANLAEGEQDDAQYDTEEDEAAEGGNPNMAQQ